MVDIKDNEYTNIFVDCLDVINIEAPYINLFICQYYYSDGDFKEVGEMIKIYRKINKKFIDNNDIMSAINIKKFKKYDGDHRFLEGLDEIKRDEDG